MRVRRRAEAGEVREQGKEREKMKQASLVDDVSGVSKPKNLFSGHKQKN